MHRVGSFTVVLALAGLAACTGGGATTTPLGGGPQPGVNAEGDAPSGDNGDLKNPVGAIRELSKVKCAADEDGAWSASATLTNSGDRASTYLVRFSVVKTKSSTVQGSAEETVDLGAGEDARIDLPDFHTEDGKGLSCSPRVVKGDAG